MVLTKVSVTKRRDGRWGIFIRGPPARALVVDEEGLKRAGTEILQEHPECLPEPLAGVEGIGIGTFTTSVTGAKEYASLLLKHGAEELK